MILDYLEGNILFSDRAQSWEDAIRKSAQPLLNNGCITPNYLEAMIENVQINGPYFILLPEVAIPHARSEKGALKNGLVFMSLKQPVIFPGDNPVKILLTLSADGDDGHLEMLGELGSALIDEKTVKRLKEASTEKEVINIFKSTEI